jgi:hypothetical protein
MDRWLALFSALLLGASCACPVNADDAPEVVVETRLQLFPPVVPGEADPQPLRLELDDDELQAKEDALWKDDCNLGDPPDAIEAVALAELAASVAKPLIRYIADRIDDELQKKLKEYTATYSASSHAPLYVKAAAPKLGLRCFQFTRIEKPEAGAEGEPSVAVDLVGRLEVVADSALVVRPLRLYFAKPAAKSSDGRYGVAFGVSGDALWREKRGGKKAAKVIAIDNLVSAEVSGESRDQHGDGTIYYRVFGPDAPVAPQALPTWSEAGQSVVHLAVSAAEVGKPNVVLKHLTELFHANKDDLVKLLEQAADEAIKGKEE